LEPACQEKSADGHAHATNYKRGDSLAVNPALGFDLFLVGRDEHKT
jgi:hypothetical protein